jgi:hypothetical protein
LRAPAPCFLLWPDWAHNLLFVERNGELRHRPRWYSDRD